jgi:hypothetical protein
MNQWSAGLIIIAALGLLVLLIGALPELHPVKA